MEEQGLLSLEDDLIDESYIRIPGISCGDAFRKLQAEGICGLCGRCCRNRGGWYKKGVSREKIGGWMWHTGGYRCKDYYWNMANKYGARININTWCQMVALPETAPNAPKDNYTIYGPGPGRRDEYGCKDSGNTYQNNMGSPTAAPTRSPTPDPNSCNIEQQRNYPGKDITSRVENNVNACAAWCHSYDGCEYWTHAKYRRKTYCWLKSAKSGSSWSKFATSGNKICTGA